MWSHNIPDPSGIAYDPVSNRILISDSEVDELPIYNNEDLFAFNLSPAGLDAAPDMTYDLPFTPEATGLAIDGNLNRMYITDDDAASVFVVDPSDPTTLLWSLNVENLGSDDTEDVAVDPATGNLFIINGFSQSIQELSLDHVGQTGTLVNTLVLSDPEIRDPEAIAYDPVHNVFLVGGGFSADIWIVDRNGDTLAKIDLLEGYRNDHVPGGSGTIRTNVKDIELAPASDGSGATHIYVADFGNSHVLDGRLIEIDPGDIFGGIATQGVQVDDTLFL
ncbi:hypothetical protein [Puniceibacterium confluentis]|uniref:hypothetical protein n=1 Tax=Puniceibacterium confluentis TaxID=1958944 RepID=UPI0011B3BFB2|nr:hypothetical protein [Puniceibacterium confluentis]